MKTIGANENCISVTKVYIGSASLSIYNGIRIQEYQCQLVCNGNVQNFLCATESVSLPVYTITHVIFCVQRKPCHLLCTTEAMSPPVYSAVCITYIKSRLIS